jgi:hypothetical protein
MQDVLLEIESKMGLLTILSIVVLQLLCQFEPASVLKFFKTDERYRLEHCLELCQKYGIIDATTFLLERVGDVGSALSLVLADVYKAMQEMDHAMSYLVKIHSVADSNRNSSGLESISIPEVHSISLSASYMF